MDILKDYFYIIFLIVAAVVQWIKSRSEHAKAQDAGKSPEEDHSHHEERERPVTRAIVPPPLPGRAPAPASAPASAPAPAKALHRAVKTPPAFQAPDISREVARQAALGEQIRLVKEAKAARRREDTKFAESAPRKMPSQSGGSLKSRLHSRTELCNAFVLKEILEKPVGLRS